jgi:hypothetical protein
MATYLKQASKPTIPKKAVKKASRVDRIIADQEVVDLPFMETAQAGAKEFQQCISILYGPGGIGKTSWACQVPGMYLIDSENKSQWQIRRATHVPNWVSFKAFIDKMEREPELVASVRMWGIDTIDVLVSKCMSTICAEWEIMDLSEEGFSRAWQELVQEVTFQVLRLRALGPGVLLVSHEREVEVKRRHLQMDHTRMDVSKSVFNALSFMSDLTMHMTYTVKDTVAGDQKAPRCLVTRGNEEQDAKNCTKAALPDVMPFKTEREAVGKVIAAFEAVGTNGTNGTAGSGKEVPAKQKKTKKKVVRRNKV